MTSLTNTLAAYSANHVTSDKTTSPSQTSDPLANEATFLKLLVSQLKNQNPMSPMDGTTFVTQLAQFSDLEQNLAMRNDLDSINRKIPDNTAPHSSTGTKASSKS